MDWWLEAELDELFPADCEFLQQGRRGIAHAWVWLLRQSVGARGASGRGQHSSLLVLLDAGHRLSLGRH